MSFKKNVLITGAAVRLGACIAHTFAKNGWRVLCHYDRSADAAAKLVGDLNAAGHEALALQANLATEDGCTSLINQVKAQVSRLDCLVNNASTFLPDTATTFDVQQAQHQWQVNLMTPLSLAAHMARELLGPPGTGTASVIHILDQKVFNLNPDYFSYTVSKLALERAVALQAQALAPSVRVCGVAPGLLYLSGPQTQENFQQASRMNLLRQPIDPDDVAKTCWFLASTDCITGTVVCVDNGQHLVATPRDVMFMSNEHHSTQANT